MKNKKKVILNLQEHGRRMLKSIGLSLLASLAFYFLEAPILFILFGLIAAILSITLFVLVFREKGDRKDR